MIGIAKLALLMILPIIGLIILEVPSHGSQHSKPKPTPILFRDGQVYTHLQGSLDQNSYKTIVLPNKLQVVLITNPNAIKGAACLKVQVGDMHAPTEHLGMAHLLEHMLLMSTETYPDANHYRKFIQDHGGYCNAFTYQEYTEYHFQVAVDHLKQSLDIFSEFFKCPLIDSQYLESEIKIVHSELEARLGDEYLRYFQLNIHLTKPESLLSKFTIGSKETLKNTKREHVLCFWKQYYRPDRMQLVVYGKESHDVLEGYVREHFSAIKDQSDQPWIFSDPPYELLGSTPSKPSKNDTSHHLIRPDLQNKLVYYKPLDPNTKKSQLSVKIQLPQTFHAYKEKTVEFIGNALDEEKERSGFNSLIREGIIVSSWCVDDLKPTGNSITLGVEFNSNAQPLIESILNLIQAKLELVREMAGQELYNTYKQIFQNRMEEYSPKTAIETVLHIAKWLPWMALEDIFSLRYKFEAFNAKEFDRFVGIALDRSKWLVTVRTNEMPVGAPLQTEPYYSIEYAVVDLTGKTDEKADLIAQEMEWGTNYIFEEVDLDMARKNDQLSAKFGSFITNATLCPFPEPYNYTPTISYTEKGLTAHLAYCKGITTKKTRVDIILETPDIDKSISAHVAFRGYISAYLKGFRIRHYEKARLSDTDIADLYIRSGKLYITFQGYPLVIQDLINLFFVDFAASHEDYLVMTQTLAPIEFDDNLCAQPHDLCQSEGFRLYTQSPPFIPTDLIGAAKHIKLEDIIAITQAKISIFVFGNTTKSEFDSIIKIVKKHVTPTTRPQNPKSTLYPARVELPTVDKLNNAVMLIHRFTRPDRIRDYMMAQLLYQILHGVFFDQLRTKEGFGYNVYSEHWGVDGKAYFTMTIQGTKDIGLVEARMRAFAQSISDQITSLSAEEFLKHKSTVASNVSSIALSLRGFAINRCFYWGHVDIDVNIKEICYTAIQGITKKELAEYMRQHANDFDVICSSSKFTKFAITMHPTQ
ncbi:insulysin [Nematocida homosporus]|uniref:insulysin n=1 Tax=Nematocida homosporus TaxID=1912981 RepID=UPI00222050AD|nr:insulysin [Nematocida homosporus]KAI5187950.1 insulysin [Nematocida homosporus]